MSATVNVNGRITPERDAVISVFDHGFLYGEGIYETMRTYHQRPFLYDRHMTRLRRSARMIELPLPFTDDDLAAQIRETQAAARIGGDVYIRVLVTRGIGELSECTTSHLFVVKNGVALTPPLDAGLLPGITREFLFDVGRDVGVEVREQVLRDEDLFGADEAFLTSTTREAVPIVTVNDRAIGNGSPGPITWKLLNGFRRFAEAS